MWLGGKRSGGMTLLELLVAMAIMAIALGMLYRAAGGSARASGDAVRYQEAVFIAETLIQANADLPESGWIEEGQSGEFRWTARSNRHVTAVERSTPGAIPLHELRVSVVWSEMGRTRSIELATLLPQRPSPTVGR